MPVLPTGRRLLYWLLGVAVLTALGWAIVGDISPAPPRSLAMTTGVPDGAYHRFGERYQEILRANGIRLELQPSSGGVENLQRLNEGKVSVGFVQGGTGPLAQDPDAPPEATPLRSLATVAFEPVWIFSTALDLSSGLGPLAGKRIAVGVPGSGNFKVATELLAVYGVTDGGPPATRFVSEGGMAAADLLARGEVDAAIMIAAPEAPAVQRLLADSSVRLASLDHVQGLARRFPFFQPVSLKRGSVDPKRDLPPQDIQLLATTAKPGGARRTAPGARLPAARGGAPGAPATQHHQPAGRIPEPDRHRFPARPGPSATSRTAARSCRTTSRSGPRTMRSGCCCCWFRWRRSWCRWSACCRS